MASSQKYQPFKELKYCLSQQRPSDDLEQYGQMSPFTEQSFSVLGNSSPAASPTAAAALRSDLCPLSNQPTY